MDFIVVPFLLAAHVPPNTGPPPMYLESKFMVHVQSESTIDNGNIRNNFVSNFLCNLICRAITPIKLDCHINDPVFIITSTTMSIATPIAEVLEETTDTIPFDYINNASFILIFDRLGLRGFNAPEGVHLPHYFTELFIRIANQMTISNFKKELGKSTHIWEMTYPGVCATNYTLDYRFENSNLINYKYNLKTISDIGLKNNMVILIKKQRSPDTCNSFTDYMFGINHIKTFFTVQPKVTEAVTDMLISIQDFGATTHNRFKLYNQDKKEIGNATEFIYLQLDKI